MSLTALTEWPARFSFVHRCLKTEIVNSRRDERRGGRRVAGDGVGARHGILTFKSPLDVPCSAMHVFMSSYGNDAVHMSFSFKKLKSAQMHECVKTHQSSLTLPIPYRYSYTVRSQISVHVLRTPRVASRHAFCKAAERACCQHLSTTQTRRPPRH